MKTYYVHWVFRHRPQQHLDYPKTGNSAAGLYGACYHFMAMYPELVESYKVRDYKPNNDYELCQHSNDMQTLSIVNRTLKR